MPLDIPDVILFEPTVHEDERGYLFESFNADLFRSLTSVDAAFVQDNHSFSRRGVLRGLHYQLPPKAQGKIIRVVSGAIFDVAVDLRRSSPSFGRWVGTELSAENRRQLWIPEGFAHGLAVLGETADLLYKMTERYSPEHDRCISWDDADLAIEWPLENPIVSSRDAQGVAFKDAELFP
ncbi:MAG: dTDP-4-dehydrorhamnose 3,5-epimerase [Hyphomicrobiales bacterium]|nr:dTDP-4-dehydrorhamnose 3,5-epimerase [Hyphomicrobiales bacterium]